MTEVLSNLGDKNDKIQTIYAEGVVNGFTDQQGSQNQNFRRGYCSSLKEVW